MHELWHYGHMSTQAAEKAWIPRPDSLGARLALIRQHMGWNIKEAALACGIAAASWREWELSGRGPRDLADVAEKVSRRTGVDDYWIMTGKENSPRPEGPGAKSRELPVGIEPTTFSLQAERSHEVARILTFPQRLQERELEPAA